jgi:hypothetical protein
LVKLVPVTETTSTLSDDVAPLDGRIQLQPDALSTDAVIISATVPITPTISSATAKFVTDLNELLSTTSIWSMQY